MRPDSQLQDSLPRVLHVASGDLWGGAEAVVYSLAATQASSFKTPVAAVVMNEGLLSERLNQAGVTTYILNERMQGTLELARCLRHIIRSFKPDIVHSHRQKENVIARLAATFTGVKLVSTIHGMLEPVAGANSLRRSLVDTINKATMVYGFDAIVCVSQENLNKLSPSFPRSKLRCVYNGIATSKMELTRPSSQSSNTLRLLALGRLVPVKRFDRLVALAGALERLTDKRIEITLAGDGPLKAQLMGDIHTANREQEVRMIGFVDDPQVLLNQTDALVITSDHEGIPMAVLEALALGVPTFGFHVGGLPEIAATGVPLYLSEAGDVEQLAKQVIKFFSAHALQIRIYPPRPWRFDIEECARHYLDLYRVLRDSLPRQLHDTD